MYNVWHNIYIYVYIYIYIYIDIISCKEYSRNLPADCKILKQIVVNLIVIFFLKPKRMEWE